LSFFPFATGQGRDFLGAKERGHKKTFARPQGGGEGQAAQGARGLHSHPVFGETDARTTRPGTWWAQESRSSDFGVVLLAPPYRTPLYSGFMELSSPVTAALPHRILTCFPILPGFCPGHYLASCWFRLNGTAIKELGREIRLWGDDVKRFGAGKDFAQRRNGCNVM